MASWNLGGAVNNTTAFCGPWPANAANYFYTSAYAMPTTRTDLGGLQPIYIGTVSIAYTSGPLSSATIVYGATETSGSHSFPDSGGVVVLRAKFTGGGTLYVGRNTTNGETLVCQRSGGTWTGGLVGSFTYGQVTTAPSALSVSSGPGSGQLSVTFGAPSNNGDLSITSYVIQYSTSLAGPWSLGSVETTTGTHVISPGSGSFYVRVYATNAAGFSQANTTASAVATGGAGRRYTGSAWTGLTAGRRYTGSSWVDLSTRRRYTGSAWVDITN